MSEYVKIYKTRDECPTICEKHSWRKWVGDGRKVLSFDQVIHLLYSTDCPEVVRTAAPFRVFLGFCAAKCMGCIFEDMLKNPDTRALYKKHD